jgi:thiol-disulfide isomerase/thioredoxin
MKFLIFFKFMFYGLAVCGFALPIYFANAADSGLTTAFENGVLNAEVKSGFHFNEKAPNLLMVDETRYKVELPKPRKAFSKTPKQNYAKARVSLYVCDDALTACEPKVIEFKGNSSVSKNSNSALADRESMPENAPESDADAKESPGPKSKISSHGFIEDDLKLACDQAARTKKLVLVDFSARWCPGCIRLEQEIFPTAAFHKQTQGFVKVHIDFDKFENTELKKKFEIHGIPTLIVLTSKQEEVSRIVDFQPMDRLTSFLKEARANPIAFRELQNKADQGDKKAALLLGERLFAAERFADSVTYLENTEPVAIELSDARVQAAKATAAADPKLKPHFIETVRREIKAEPASSRSIVWRTELAEALEIQDERKKTADEGVAVADRLLQSQNRGELKIATRGDAVGEFTGYEKLYIASERADLIEAAKLGDEANQKAMEVVTKVGRELGISSRQYGPSLRYLIFLVAAHQYPEAESQARGLLKQDPQNPEIQRRLLRILNERKKFPEAITVGFAALSKSYGKNEVWVAQQLAKAYSGNQQKLEAKALLQSYLERPDIDWKAMPTERKDFDSQLANL